MTHWKDVLLLEGVTLTQDARQLNGSERAVLDGLLTPAECGVLLQLAKDAAEAGARSGYRGRRSPHTPHERFEGLTVLKAAQVRGDALPWSEPRAERTGRLPRRGSPRPTEPSESSAQG